MAVPRFTVELDLDAGNGNYDTFIRDLRERLAVGERIEGVPILAEQVAAGGDIEFFNVNLSYSGSTIQAQFRADNLYLVRFRPGTAGPWQELDGIENYNTLTDRDHGNTRLEDIPLSGTRIGTAVTTLAGGETDPGRRSRAILTVIFAIAEAARFRDMSSLIVRAWWNETTPGLHYAARVRSWARMSSAVQRLRSGDDRTWDFDGESTDIWAFVSAILSLGIMHLANTGTHFGPSADATSHSAFPLLEFLYYTANRLSFRRSVDTTSYTAFAQGQPLLEILYIRLNSTDGGTPCKLYGTVTVTDSARTHSIWQHNTSNPVDIYPQDKILLEGPSRPMSSADEFNIQLDLWDHVGVSGDSIAKGTIVFNPLDSFTVYDVVKVQEVKGDYGSVTVGYVAIVDGLYAQISVVLTDGNGNNPANVYGSLTANNGHGETDLFRKPKDQYVEVTTGDKIPLVKTVVAVATTGHLNVHANLWVHSDSGDDELAYGDVEFQPLYKQSQKKAIMGENGKVEVRVTWM